MGRPLYFAAVVSIFLLLFFPRLFSAVADWMCTIFGRPFVKRFALCYQTIVCLFVLSVTLVYCGQMVGWIKMKLGMQLGLSSGHIVLDGDPAPPPQKGHSPQFLAQVCCGQTDGWIKVPLDMEVDVGSGNIVLDGDHAAHTHYCTDPDVTWGAW